MGTNPFRIPIGTSDPVDICQGLPLYPSLGTARAGATGAGRSTKLIDVSATVLITRLKIAAYYSWGVGICGPAISFLSPDVDVLRENIGDEGHLTLTFNEGLEMQAGLFVGASIGFGLNLGLQVYLPQPWYKVWSLAWRDAFSVDIGFSVDILALLFEMIQFLLSRNSASSFAADSQNRLRDTLPDLRRTFGMLDTTGSNSTVERDLSATPTLTLPFNFVNYFPPLKAFNDGLSKVCGEISVGPSFHLQFPVTLNFTKFTVVGGLEDATSADYGSVDYVGGNQLTATGKIQFDTQEKPSRVTSHVTYDTSFVVSVSMHFRVGLAKFFNFEINSPSLDLTYLLTGTAESDRAIEVDNTVSTCVEDGMILTPNMTLAFTGSNGRRASFVTGETVTGTISLPGYSSSNATDVEVQIRPAVAGFPSRVTVAPRSHTASFSFRFQNQCLPTGDRNDRSATTPPSAITPLQTYSVRAFLASESNAPCSDYEVEVPLNIEERFLRCQRVTAPGTSPPWDPLAGGKINADSHLPTDGGSNTYVAPLALWFPYLKDEARNPVRVRFTLLDENRQLHTGSDVVIRTNEGFLPLAPSATGTVTLAEERQTNPPYGLIWNSRGPHTGYSNRFFLIVDAGCQYGQTEFWLDVWNWS